MDDVPEVTNIGCTPIGIDNILEIDDDPILGDLKESLSKRAKAKNASFVWDHFTKIPQPKDVPWDWKQKSTCNYCGTEFCCHSDINGTSSMKTHLAKRCKEYEFSDAYQKKHGVVGKRQKTLGFEPVGPGDMGPKLTAVSFNAEACRKALAEMIIVDELPFRFVEGQGFKKFMHVVQPRWTKIPSRVTIAKDCLNLYKDGKKALKKVFKSQRICLTTDTWTSLQNLNYMVFTAHFIDGDWKLHKKIINFCLVSNHKGETLGREVDKCLQEWGIEKILTITIDNASSNNGIIDFLKKKNMKKDNTILGHEFLHVRCCAHILNLIVRDGLKEVDVSIARVRNIVRYVKSSPQRYRKFRECVEEEKIDSKLVPCLDVPTRWNSTFFMLERAVIYQRAFEKLEEEDRLNVVVGVREDFVGVDNTIEDVVEEEIMGGGRERGRERVKGRGKDLGVPSSEDWIVVQTYVDILRTFYIVTERFSGSLYVTCNTFYRELTTVKNAIAKLESSDDPNLCLLGMSMVSKFDKYWGKFEKFNQLLLYANVLDPRHKFKYLRWSLAKYLSEREVEMKVMEIKEGMKRVYTWYENKSLEHEKAEASHVKASNNKEKNGKRSFDFSDEYEDEYDQEMDEETNMVSKSELERYWLEPVEDRKNGKFDLLTWWSSNCARYHILSQMARDILAIPVSTVASESAFSTGGRILDPYRTSLAPKMAEALICAQNWLRYPCELSLRDMLDEVEELESVVLEANLEESCVTND